MIYRIYGIKRGEHYTTYLGAQQANTEEDAKHQIRKAFPGAKIERIEPGGTSTATSAPPIKTTAAGRQRIELLRVTGATKAAYRLRIANRQPRKKPKGFYTDENGIIHPIEG